MKKFSVIILLLIGISTTAQVKKWTLRECVNYAIEHNISIKQAEIDYAQAEINKKDAFGNFLPSVNASASQSWNIGLGQDPVTFNAVTSTSTTRNLSGGISVDIDLYDGMRNLFQFQKSKLQILASHYQLENMANDISLFVANAFLQILLNKEQVKVLESQLEVSSSEESRIKDLILAGVLPEGDLLEVQATKANQEQQLVIAENSVYLSKVSLAQLLLITDYENFDIVESDYLIPDVSILNERPINIFEKAKTTRKEILIAELNVEAAQRDLKIAKATLQPTLTGSYAFGSNYFTEDLSDTDNFETPISDNKSHNFRIQLNIPIFNGLAAKNNVKRNELELERRKNQLEQEALNLESTVYQAFNDAEAAVKAYDAAVKTLSARELAYQYAKERYDVGLLNSFDFSQSKNQFVSAQSDAIRAKYDFIFKIKVLEFYFGIPITNLAD